MKIDEEIKKLSKEELQKLIALIDEKIKEKREAKNAGKTAADQARFNPSVSCKTTGKGGKSNRGNRRS